MGRLLRSLRLGPSEAPMMLSDRPDLKYRIEQLEEALADLRGVAETTYAVKPPENSEQWDFLLDAITRANAFLAHRKVEADSASTENHSEKPEK